MNCADNDECSIETDNCDLKAACANNKGSFVCTCNEGWEGTRPMLMLLSNVPVKLDTLVMVSFALASTNASKRMPVMLIPLVTILLVLMSAHDTLVTAAMVNPVLIMRMLKW